jgi:ATP-dependent helicase/nuclease subunit A
MSSFTPAQQSAIAARGNVLVVAGAGTGKTRTLVERCLRLLREGVSLEEMLIVTFTTAAAAEMRARLRKALEDEVKVASLTTAAPRFAEQAALLDTAQISTLHSFCLGLVREHFHELAIDPQVVVLDERQTRPLARECLTELLAGHYAGRWPHSAALQQFIRRHGRGSDESLRALVGRLLSYAQSLPDPDGWLADSLAACQNAEPVRWREWLAPACRNWRSFWRPLLEDSPPALAFVLSRAALEAEEDDLPALAGVLRMVTEADQDWPHGTKQFRKDFDKFFDDAAFLLALTGPDGSATALNEDWEWSRHELAALVELTRQFAGRLTEAKRQLGGVDFADVEQLSLRLLRDESSAAARRCRERFAHVFVDEYQDINEAQDAILRAVSRSGAEANRFLVGDIKQSIYRFRLANPRIFADYAEAWRAGSSRREEAPASVIPLADNFRSHPAVLDFVNALFRPLMRASAGGVSYDAAAELHFGNASERAALAAKSSDASRIELHVLTSNEPASSDETDETEAGVEELLAIEREARFVATRLREWHRAAHPVWDESARGFRPVQWRDMVVLMRSPGSRGEAFAKEFHRVGVPLHAERGGFYESLEVTDLLNLLRLLDNPLQDLPLLAVLRSPLVGLSLEELVGVRKAAERALMWDALAKFRAVGMATGSQEPAGAWSKADEFLTRFAEWRQLIRLGSLTQCLERVLTGTHYEALLLAEPRGPERVANVRRLLDLARQFDPLQRQGLHRFLRFIEAQEEAELDHDPAPLPTEDAVRLMSIHQSKGLEFPVVVVAGLGVRFNLRDLSGDVLLDGEFGLCPMVSPPKSQRRYPSLPHWLAKQRGRSEMLGEELRVLYVALTRARDTLLLCGTDAGKSVAEKWRAPAAAISDPAVLKARCPLDWLRLWLSGVAKEADWLGDASGRNELLSWRLHAAGEELRSSDDGARLLSPPLSPSEGEGEETAGRSQQEGAMSRVDEEATERLRERLTQTYPHESATREQAKTSVSVLRRRAEADEEAFQLFPASQLPRVPRRRRGGLTATQVGLAHHAFLQHVELRATGTRAELMAEAERLRSRGVLTEREGEALVFEDLFRFWDSEVGRLVRRHAKEAQREVPFTARFTARELNDLTGPRATGGSQIILTSSLAGEEDFVIVQGVVDLAVFCADEIWLLDYKTDRFGEVELAAKLREHSLQLRLYARALERIYQKTVTRRWLHFLALGRTEAV